MGEFNYYWEKAEFQDKHCHAENLRAYMNGRKVSEFFDDRYKEEAVVEFKKIVPDRYEVLLESSSGPWFAYDADKDEKMCYGNTEYECFINLIDKLRKEK